ncbi:MAG: amino acid-binding protein [Mailhella sp.]|jgi:hypothetical protein|nr:amino acid-binding protein [Mailhella sp.]
MIVDEFSLLIQEVVMADPASLHNMARNAGKKCSTLIREANPYDSGAKMSADTLLKVMESSGDVRPLIYMARKMGLELRKQP